MSVVNKDPAWELPKVPGEYTGWKKIEVQGPPRPGGGPEGRIPLAEIDFEYFEDQAGG